jgi:hypothetical protein
MKRKLLSIFTTLALGLSVNAQTKIYDFAFDNSLIATVGTGTFVSSGSSFITDRNGNANEALSLTNQAIASLSNLPIGNSDRTVSLWFKVPNAPTSASNIVRYGAFSGAGVFGVYLFGGYAFQTGADNFSITNTPQPNTWTHLVLRLSNNVVNIYTDGVLNTTVNTTLNTLLGDFQLGESGFSLEIDDLKIYDGALTGSQITEVYTNNDLTSPGVNSQTKIYDFPFDNSLTATVGTGTFASSGTSFTTDRDGNASKALSLTNATIATLSALPIGNNDRTVSLWFKVSNAPSSAANIARYGVFNGAGVFGVYSNNSFSLAFQSGADNLALTNSPQLNTWTHLLYSLSNDTVVTMYLNGTLSTTASTTINTLLGDFQLGENGFSIEIDDLKIYDGALTASQVTEVYTNNDLTTASIENSSEINLFKVFPNPANEKVTISNIEAGSTVSLVDLSGKIISQTTANSSSLTIPISDFNAGVYFVRVMTENGAVGVERLVVE